jgi:hypothetical protein
MNINAIYAWCFLAGLLPFLAMVATLAHYCLWRVVLRRGKNSARIRSRVYPICLALGMAFLQLVREFYQPGAVYLLEAKQDEEAELDDAGDPENLKKQLNRQLKRIRRGLPVERLVLRL